jgi:sulfur carrier protein
MTYVTLTINGETRRVEAATSLLDFLAQEGMDPRTVAVEYNGTVLFRRELENVRLQEADRLEIVRAVAGG